MILPFERKGIALDPYPILLPRKKANNNHRILSWLCGSVGVRSGSERACGLHRLAAPAE